MKKLLSVILVFAVIVSFGVSAYAAGEISITSDLPSSVTAVEGDTYTLDVTVDANGNDSIQFQVYNQTGVVKEGTCSGGKLTFQRTATTADEYIYIKFIGPSNEVTSAKCLISVSAKGALKITKSPTGETVEEFGSAKFIARAENYDKIIWRIVSNDTTNTIPADEAEGYFRGVSVSGLGTETLVLSNIPASMDGWRVEAKFVGKDGTVDYSMGAKITVLRAGPVNPSITTQPVSVAAIPMDQSATLTVAAKATDGGTLKYQWYTNTTESTNGGIPVSGATLPSFTAAKTEGTVYYYVAVRNSADGNTSDAVYSNVVSVTYLAAPEEEPQAPETAPEGSGTAADPGTPVSDTPSAQIGSDEDVPVVVTPAPAEKGNNDKSNTMLLVIGAILVVAIVAAAITVIILRRNDSDVDE